MILGIIVGIIALSILVATHELGHAIIARRNGVVVEEFGIGFPPRAYSRVVKKSFLGNNVRFSINWLPIGGFVKLQGEHDAADKKGDYGAATFWQKTKILFAGVAVNWLTAVVLFTGLSLVGLPKLIDNQFYIASDASVTNHPVKIGQVGEKLPAAAAGLETGDEIISFGGTTISSPTQLSNLAKEHKGETVSVVYKRDDVTRHTVVTIREENTDGHGYFGAGISKQQDTIRATWSAPIVGIVTTAQLTQATLQGLGDMIVTLASGLIQQFSGDAAVSGAAKQQIAELSNTVAGPVGIFGVIFPAAEQAGFAQVILLTAVVALSLAVMNALPIPALDGGRWFVTALFRLCKKHLPKDTEEKIQAGGFLFLMSLIVLVTIADIGKLM